MKRNTNTTKKVAASLAIAAMCAVTITGCAVAAASGQPADKPDVEFGYVCDWPSTKEPSGATRILAEQAEKSEQAERDAAEAAAAEQPEWTAEYYEPEPYVASQPSVMGNPDGLNSFDGVYEYGGRTETFYSTHAVYDSQLTVDEQGFYRDGEGRYVVASSDYAEGTEIEISQGKAVVMDDGPESGVVDVHTTWR